MSANCIKCGTNMEVSQSKCKSCGYDFRSEEFIMIFPVDSAFYSCKTSLQASVLYAQDDMKKNIVCRPTKGISINVDVAKKAFLHVFCHNLELVTEAIYLDAIKNVPIGRLLTLRKTNNGILKISEIIKDIPICDLRKLIEESKEKSNL